MYIVNNTVSEVGIGLFSGRAITLTLSPAYSDGIWFKNKNGLFQKLTPDNVKVDNHNTAIVFSDGSTIKLIEHLLAAVYAFGISNIMISVNDDEIPLFDGSSMSYIYLIKNLFLTENKNQDVAFLRKKVEIREGEFYVRATPHKEILIDSTISFPGTPIGKQSMKFKFSKYNFINEIATARTFGVVHDLKMAKQFYKGATLENTLIIADNKLLNKQRLDNEFVKHKVLDSIGDLRTFEYPLIMKYKSFGSSHRMNNLLLKKIIEEKAFEVVKMRKNSIEENFGINMQKQFAFAR